jgi:PPP family 3-phenylpropionic acid transporter
VLTARGPRQADPLMPVMMWLTLLGAFVASLRLRGTGETSARPRLDDLGALLGDRRFRLLVMVGPLHWASCVPYNVYFGVLLHDLALSPLVSGLSFSVGVAAEMLVLLWFRRLRGLASLDRMLVVCFAGSAARWLTIFFVHDTVALMALQSLHGLTFGLFWGTAIAYLTESVPPALRATGQALFVMSLNLGSALGNAATGALYDAAGARTLFLAAAALQMAPLALAWRARRFTAPAAAQASEAL